MQGMNLQSSKMIEEVSLIGPEVWPVFGFAKHQNIPVGSGFMTMCFLYHAYPCGLFLWNSSNWMWGFSKPAGTADILWNVYHEGIVTIEGNAAAWLRLRSFFLHQREIGRFPYPSYKKQSEGIPAFGNPKLFFSYSPVQGSRCRIFPRRRAIVGAARM